MGAYLCIASNDVPPAVSKRVFLHVHCKYQWPRNRYLHPSIHPRHSLTMTGTRTTDTAPMMMIMIVCCDSHQPPSHAEYVSGTHGETLLPLLPRWILLLFKCRPRNHRAVAIQFEESAAAAAAASMASVRCDWNFNFPRPLLSSPHTHTHSRSRELSQHGRCVRAAGIRCHCPLHGVRLPDECQLLDEGRGQEATGPNRIRTPEGAQ